MLQKFITREFIEKFNELNNKVARVQIKHVLYGNQNLKRCILRPFVDGECIGLIMDDGEKKYFTMDELCSVSINEKTCTINSDVMELYIDYSEF